MYKFNNTFIFSVAISFIIILINLFVLLFIMLWMPVSAAEKPKSFEKWTIAGKYLTAREAFQFKQAQGEKLLFVDIRTPSELNFVGSPKNMDINIPLVTMDYKQWDDKASSFKKIPNKHFISAFNNAIQSRGMTKDSSIVLLCRSGKRSARAANLLTSNGYSKVYTVVDGFEGDKAKLGSKKGKRVVNGWKNAGLPWTYKLQQSHLTLN